MTTQERLDAIKKRIGTAFEELAPDFYTNAPSDMVWLIGELEKREAVVKAARTVVCEWDDVGATSVEERLIEALKALDG